MRIKEYKESLKNVKKEMDFSKNGLSERDQLLGNTELNDQQQDQRSRLLHGTEKLSKTSNRLDEAHRMALETEQMGISTLGDLERQRRQLEDARDGVCFQIQYFYPNSVTF
jgi:vesicle transport through interaction with t-SNAREs protein 1